MSVFQIRAGSLRRWSTRIKVTAPNSGNEQATGGLTNCS